MERSALYFSCLHPAVETDVEELRPAIVVRPARIFAVEGERPKLTHRNIGRHVQLVVAISAQQLSLTVALAGHVDLSLPWLRIQHAFGGRDGLIEPGSALVELLDGVRLLLGLEIEALCTNWCSANTASRSED